MKNKLRVLGLALSFVFAAAMSLQAATHSTSKVFDSTSTTSGWQVYTEKAPAATVDMGPGVKKGSKGLVWSYKFEDGLWIALIKMTNFSLGEKDAIRFYYKGTGATVNLKIKVSDAGGAVFGFTCPAGSNVAEWREVEAPRSQFVYLWGGQGADSMNWDNLVKFEFTLDLDNMAGSTYTIEKTTPGKLSIANISIVTKK